MSRPQRFTSDGFNPRPRARGRPRVKTRLNEHPCFNPRPRARGRPPFIRRPCLKGLFQSTPPCEGATYESLSKLGGDDVSIHAPVRGGDDVIRLFMGGPSCFNPRPRARGRPKGDAPDFVQRGVSIHAPVRGGDGMSRPQRFTSDGFNPRPRARGRPRVKTRLNEHPCFNPRPRARGRPPFIRRPCLKGLFQSTPPCEGATVRVAYTSPQCSWFQSTPPCEGATVGRPG